MMRRLLRFWRQPPSRRRQRLNFAWMTLVTHWLHRPRLRALGMRSLIGKPLFWTPEYLEIGNDVLIWCGCRLEGIDLHGDIADSPPRIILHDQVSIQQYCHLTAAQHLEIGARTSVLFNVMITDTDHCYEQIGISPATQPLRVSPTTIGEDCFIGARASIQAGTQLGRHCIVGTNAVVRGVFPDYCVLVGAPARVVKRYDPLRCTWRRTTPSGDFLLDVD